LKSIQGELKNMNRMILSVVAVSALTTALFAQVPGGFGPQEGRVPGQVPAGQGFGQALRGGGSASVAASDRYVYVLRGNTLFQYSADGLKLVAKTELPAVEARGGVDGSAGRGQGGGRGNRDAQPPVK
jgi:hypothetical protein